MNLLDGKKLSEKFADNLCQQISSLDKSSGKPKLAIIQIGHVKASDIYISYKLKFAKKIGAEAEVKNFSIDTTTEKIISEIKNLNSDKNIHGIIVQLPVSEQIKMDSVLNSIDPKKDVDGLSAENIYKLSRGENDGIIPATTRGILELLQENKISIVGKKVTIVGRSNLVGKPTAMMMINQNATVTICHSKTPADDLYKSIKNADIVISAVGQPGIIKRENLSPNQIVIDVGITAGNDGKIHGDVDFNIENKGDFDKSQIAAITPVPGGVGPMTVASLFLNLIEAYNRQNTN